MLVILVLAALVLLLLLVFILQNGQQSKCRSSARTEACRWALLSCWPQSSAFFWWHCRARYGILQLRAAGRRETRL
jgi:hypothetical protein